MTTATATATAPTADLSHTALSRQDRCDRCGAQAFVRANFGSEMTLLFCGHHYRGHQAALADAGAHIHDERHRIDEQA